jgi:hypothetical protein
VSEYSSLVAGWPESNVVCGRSSSDMAFSPIPGGELVSRSAASRRLYARRPLAR